MIRPRIQFTLPRHEPARSSCHTSPPPDGGWCRRGVFGPPCGVAQKENKELKDRVLYTLAEMENVRTIARRCGAHHVAGNHVIS
jgi:hypothetical protein